MAAPRRKAGKTSSRTASGGDPSPTRRRVAVLVSLVGVLTLTSALLRALAPAPLNPQASSSLFAIEAPQSLDEIFSTASQPVAEGRWHFIYIHHSGTLSGNAQTIAESAGGLPDHFVIGNGDGCEDGAIQIGQRWSQQLEPGAIPGTKQMKLDYISICLIGDFNQTRPTATQQRRLAQLVSTLQNRLGIPRGNVFVLDGVGTPAGVGHYFPTAEFKAQILP